MIDTTQLDKILNKFLEQFECEVTIDTDFAYWYGDSKITYTLVVGSQTDIDFMKFVEVNFPKVKADIFLWSFMHELGHHMTMDLLEDEEMEFSDMEKYRLEKADLTPTEKNFVYFNLPDEYAATEWAAKYMLEHSDEIRVFWSEVKNAILAFYELHEISDEF